MTRQLYINMYLSGNQPPSTLFGLCNGQWPVEAETHHNSVWHNKAGDYLGMGALTPTDLQNIAAGLAIGEVFLVVGPGPATSARDLRQLAARAVMLIVQGQVYSLKQSALDFVRPITEQQAYQLLTAGRSQVRRLAEAF